MKSRIFNIMQYEFHPETGEPLLNEEQIKDCVSHRTIKRWAYIFHDKDVYSEKDEADDPSHIAGMKKPGHWHLVIEMGSNQTETYTIAKWLGIAENFVNVGKGRGAFLDCVEYLTHEEAKQQELGKTLYSDNEIISNFDFREELTKRAERRLRYGRDLNEKDMLRNEVLFHGMTLKTAWQKYPIEYQNDMTYLKKCRLEYIDKMAPIPPMRMNFYIEGMGGVGKGLISKAIARSIIDSEGNMEDDEIFFNVGADDTTFEGYDGQPVIIWNDCRAFTLIEKLDGRENVFNVFDPFPPNIRQNVKFGSVSLKNTINIVNSIQPWSEFLDGLSGEYKDSEGNIRKSEDKSQSYRRFPFFLVLHENDYDLGMNKGLFDGTREYEQYYMLNGIKANFRRIAAACGNDMELVRIVNGKAVKIVKDKYIEMKDHMKPELTDRECVLKEFENVGEVPPQTPEEWYNSVYSKNPTRSESEIPDRYKKRVNELKRAAEIALKKEQS